ncbi:hypothetical protein D3C85_1758640 [compost metagenome]
MNTCEVDTPFPVVPSPKFHVALVIDPATTAGKLKFADNGEQPEAGETWNSGLGRL